MNIKNPKKKYPKKLIITISVVVLLIVAGLLWYYAFASSNPTEQEPKDSTEQGVSTNSSSASGEEKSNTKADDQPVEHEKEKNIQPPYEGEVVNSSNSLTGVINYKAVTDGNLIIRTTINQTLSSGTCQLTLSSNDKTVTKSANIVQNPSSSTCQGFDVPVSELGQGTWQIDIEITSGDKNTTLKGTVEI